MVPLRAPRSQPPDPSPVTILAVMIAVLVVAYDSLRRIEGDRRRDICGLTIFPRRR